jgi:hypothetical protein
MQLYERTSRLNKKIACTHTGWTFQFGTGLLENVQTFGLSSLMVDSLCLVQMLAQGGGEDAGGKPGRTTGTAKGNVKSKGKKGSEGDEGNEGNEGKEGTKKRSKGRKATARPLKGQKNAKTTVGNEGNEGNEGKTGKKKKKVKGKK